jgi:hypothetical protein
MNILKVTGYIIIGGFFGVLTAYMAKKAIEEWGK